MHIRFLGRVEYLPTFHAMQHFAAGEPQARGEELWMCEHPQVFTLGRSTREQNWPPRGAIPVVQTDRGGEVTYHGPGQVVAYPLVHLRRRGYYVREYVFRLEEAVLRTLARLGITGHRVAGAPGVYVRPDDPCRHALLPQRPARRLAGSARPVPDFSGVAKIAALGVKVGNDCCTHGVALNVAMDLEPFRRINACGYAGLETIDLASLGVDVSCADASRMLAQEIVRLLGEGAASDQTDGNSIPS